MNNRSLLPEKLTALKQFQAIRRKAPHSLICIAIKEDRLAGTFFISYYSSSSKLPPLVYIKQVNKHQKKNSTPARKKEREKKKTGQHKL